MRIILATVSFLIAAGLLWYGGAIAFFLHREVGFADIDFSEPEIRFAFIILAGSLILGLAFVTAGIAVLASKSRRKQ